MRHLFCSAAGTVLRPAFLLFFLSSAGQVQAQLFSDAFEAGLGSWDSSGGWGVTASDAHSPTHAATDSPGAYYTNATDAALTLAAPLNLSAATRPALRFHHRYALEDGFDWAFVEASTNGGASWAELASYTGLQTAW